MLNFLNKSIENGTDADLVYLDFANVFDSVLDNRLICKLHNYGIVVIYHSGLKTFYHREDNKFE